MSEEELREEVEYLKSRVQDLEAMMEGETPSVTRSMDLSTFIQDFDPTTHTERAAAIAYYLEAYEDQDEFMVSDISEGYEQARISPPANMSDVVGSCEDQGWVMRKGKDGQSTIRQLTKAGIEMVEEEVDNGA